MNKYTYYKVIQGNYGFGYEDVDFHETDSGYYPKDNKTYRENVKAYRENETQYAHRTINRRELNT